MSTNYYARLDREATDVTIHIGLLGSGVVALSGVLFDSWADMKRFLVRNESFGLWIVDEAGVRVSVPGFIVRVESYTEEERATQFRSAPFDAWLDSDGFSISGYDFT